MDIWRARLRRTRAEPYAPQGGLLEQLLRVLGALKQTSELVWLPLQSLAVKKKIVQILDGEELLKFVAKSAGEIF